MKNPLSNIGLLVVVASLTAMITSCNPQGPEYIDEQDVTFTYYDAEFYASANDYQTFEILSIGLVTEKEDESLSKADSAAIAERLSSGFTDMGYRMATEGEQADFYINAVLAEQTNTMIGGAWWWGYPGYWGGWGYPYPPMWGGWYPWWGPGYAYQYTIGSMLIDKVDAESHEVFSVEYEKRLAAFEEEHSEPANDKDKVGIVEKMAEDGFKVDFRWEAIIQGVLSGNSQYNQDRLERGLNEAFEMSPYMNKSNAQD